MLRVLYTLYIYIYIYPAGLRARILVKGMRPHLGMAKGPRPCNLVSHLSHMGSPQIRNSLPVYQRRSHGPGQGT